jgi:hypothetical protein
MKDNHLFPSGKAMTRPTQLLLPPRLPIEEWKLIGVRISRLADASGWWLGDWLIFGEFRYPERYKRAIEETTLDYQTLRNYAWIARKIEPARRREKLSMQHHAEVAALPEKEQDRWLDFAEKMSWTRTDLRNRLRQERLNTNGESMNEIYLLKLEASPAQRQLWAEAARKTNRSLSRWMRSTLDREAKVALEQELDTEDNRILGAIS